MARALTMERSVRSGKRLRFADHVIGPWVTHSWNVGRGVVHSANFSAHSDFRNDRVLGGVAGASGHRLSNWLFDLHDSTACSRVLPDDISSAVVGFGAWRAWSGDAWRAHRTGRESTHSPQRDS